MSIPGHGPRPTSPPDPDRRHLAPHRRDAGLDRVAQVTRWTLVGGLALTGGIAVVAAGAQPGHARTRVADAAVTVPGPVGDPTTSSASTPTSAPAAQPGVDHTTSPATQPVQAAPTPTAPAPTAPPLTAPPQPAYTPPVDTVAPPVVASGAS